MPAVSGGRALAKPFLGIPLLRVGLWPFARPWGLGGTKAVLGMGGGTSVAGPGLPAFPPLRPALLPAGSLGPQRCHCGISNLGPLGAAFSASPSSIWKLPQHSALFLLPLLLGHPGRPSARLAGQARGGCPRGVPHPTGAGPGLPPPAFPPSVLWLEVSRCRIRWCGLRNQTPGVGSGLRTDGRGPPGRPASEPKPHWLRSFVAGRDFLGRPPHSPS